MKNAYHFASFLPSAVVIHRDLFQELAILTRVFQPVRIMISGYEFVQNIRSLLRSSLLRKFGGHDDQLSRKFWGMDRFRVEALYKIIKL